MKVQQRSALALVGLLSCVSEGSAWATQTPFSPTTTSVLAGVVHHEQRQAPPTTRRFVNTRLFTTSEPGVNEKNPTKNIVIQGKKLSAAAGAIPEVISLPTVASVLVATVATFVLNNSLNMGPVKASSIVGLLSACVLPQQYAIAAFCASFAGMAKTAVIPSVAASGVLGLVCAAMLTLFDQKKWLVGVGGRLGFVAQLACTTQFLIASLLFGTPAAPAALVGSTPLNFRILAAQLPMVASLTVGGALFMRYWKYLLASKSKRLSSLVGSVSVTGLLAGLALPPSMAGPIFCGSFVAMAAPTKLPTLMSLVWASILAGAAQQSLAGVMLGGWGGKLGTAALMGVLAYRGLAKIVPDENLETKMGVNNMKVPR